MSKKKKTCVQSKQGLLAPLSLASCVDMWHPTMQKPWWDLTQTLRFPTFFPPLILFAWKRLLPEEALKITNESVDVSLPSRLVDDVLVVVVAQPATQLLVVHLGLILPDAPPAGHLVRIGEFELPPVPRPADEPLTWLVREELEEELPQLDWTWPREAGPQTWS